MAIADITKPIALDETLQSTNGLLGTQNGKLDSIVTAIMSISLASVGNVNSLTTTDKTSLVGAVNELNAGKVSTSSVGVAGGVAELDNTGKVPASQLPAFVDDVIEGYLYNGNFYEDSAHTQLITPEDGKIYIDLVSNKTYRWSGTQYTVISDTLALGETSSTAYRGDRGKAAYDHSQDPNRVTQTIASGLYKIGVTAQGHVSGTEAVTKSDLVALGIVGSVTASTTNGNIKVDDVEVQVYDDTEVKTALSDATTEIEGNPISFSTLTAQNATECIIDLDPIQDLHGYDKPWVGGAGKNLLPMILDDIKSANTSGSWSENVYTLNNVTFTILPDNDDNVIGVSVNNTTAVSNNTRLFFPNVTISEEHKLSGCPSGGGNSTYRLECYNNSESTWKSDSGSGATLDAGEYNKIAILVYSGQILSNKIFYPMIRKSTDSAGFEPYTNICPITGRTQVGIEGCGKNLGDFTVNSHTATANVNQAVDIGTLHINTEMTLKTSWKQSAVLSSCTRNCLYLHGTNGDYFPDDVLTPSLSAGVHSGTIQNVSAGDYTIKYWTHTFSSSVVGSDFMILRADDTDISTYSPYTESNDLTIAFGQTVYGASLDVKRGVLSVDRVLVDLDTFTWGTITNTRWHTGDQATYKPTSSSSSIPNLISEKYETVSPSVLYNSSSNGITITTTSDIICRNGSTTTPPSGNIAIELATPTEIQLTPHEVNLLKGANYISVSDDFATITLTYRSGEVATLGDLLAVEDNLEEEIANAQILTDTVTGDKYILVVTNGVLDIQQVSN
jgi:hypothetical protein